MKIKLWKLESGKLFEDGILKINNNNNNNKEMWKLEFWTLEIKFGNWNFENYLRIGEMKIKSWIGVLEIIWRWNFKNK